MTGDPRSGDAALVRRLSAGEERAVHELYARYGRPLFAYVRDLTGDPQLAEEVVQDTFVAAWREAGRFEGRSSLSSWLFGIARRQARDRLRRFRPGTEPVDSLAAVPAEDAGPEAAAIASASRDEVRDAIRSIAAQHREVLLLTFAHGLTGPEIAAVLGVPEGTVKSRLFAARRALRGALEARGVR